MPTKRIKRFEPELHWKHAGNPSVRMKEKEGGQFVHHDDYAKLEERVLTYQGACALMGHDYLKIDKDHNTYQCTKCGHMDFEDPE